MHWCTGMLGGDDYQEGIAESVDVQKLNTRAAAKTYHLVISFRPEDEAKLTPDTFKAIEERFAAALGYSDHQRHCGVHKNTGNLHMHVAYNMFSIELSHGVRACAKYTLFQTIINTIQVRQSTKDH